MAQDNGDAIADGESYTLTSALVLPNPDFTLHTDASETGLCTVLSQIFS